jgi:uncharacterized membrane protein YcaP (DUF421 family)
MNPLFWPEAGEELLRIAILAPLAYGTLILVLRLSGKRMLSKMSAFDLVVTIALGSTLATILLSNEVTFAEGALALGLLIGLQYVVAFMAARSKAVRRIIKSEPTLLLFRGEILREACRRENVSAEAVVAALRDKGVGRVEDVAAAVLEADGQLSVVRATPGGPRTTLRDVRRPEEAEL